MEAATALTSWARILGRSDSDEFSQVRRMVSATQRLKWVVKSWVSGEKCIKSYCSGSSFALSADLIRYMPSTLTGHRSLSRSFGNKWAIPGNSNGFGISSGRWFFGMNLATTLTETCLAPESKVLRSRLWGAWERATSSGPRAPISRATRKAVL